MASPPRRIPKILIKKIIIMKTLETRVMGLKINREKMRSPGIEKKTAYVRVGITRGLCKRVLGVEF